MFQKKTIPFYCIFCSLFVGAALLPTFRKQMAMPAVSLADVPLTIFFLSAPGGKFQTSSSGQEVLHAIHVLIQRARKERKSEKGGVLFLQGGLLSQARNARDLKEALIRPGFHLASYMGYDGIALPNKELQLLKEILEETSLRPRLQRLPLLGFNIRNPAKMLPLVPYKIVSVQGHPVFLSALIVGPEPDFASNPWKGLAMELKRQNGIELSILLLDGMADEAPHGTEDSYMDPHLPKAFSTRQLLDSKAFFGFFTEQKPPRPVSLPTSHKNRFAHKTLLFVSSKKPNRFYRHLAGPYICTTQSGYICRLDLLIRKKQIIQLKQRFLSVKGLLGHIQEEGRAAP